MPFKKKVAKKTNTKKPITKKSASKAIKAKTKVKAKKLAKPAAKKAPVRSKSKKKPALLKTKSKKTSTFKSLYNEDQKSELLNLVEKIVTLHKYERGGLRSLDGIDRILDKHNQHYKNVNDKFHAITQYGLDKDPALVSQSIFIRVNAHRPDEDALYKLLEDIHEDKIQFADAKKEMMSIYNHSKHSKQSK